jgi:hypothetical protein
MRTSFARAGSPLGSALFQLTPKSVRSDPLSAVRVCEGRRDRACDLDGPGDTLDRDLAAGRDHVAAEVDVLGREVELGVHGDVEELGRQQMRGQVLVLDVDARDVRAALEAGALALHGQLSGDVPELALERAGEVGDLELDRRVHGIELPGAGEGRSCGCAHFVCPPLSCTI